MAPLDNDSPAPGSPDDLAADKIDYQGDEVFLRSLGHPEDAWLFTGQKWYRSSEVAEQLAISEDTVNRLLQDGLVPGAILHGDLGTGTRRRSGWRVPRSGLIVYMARIRRERMQRQQPSAG